MEIFTHIDTWVALLTLTFLEIVLGIDNIIFISITVGEVSDTMMIKRPMNLLFQMLLTG